jgi:membrane-bound lytic murein transglycosylase MltF
MTKLAMIKLITTYCLMYGIDPKIAVSVASVESGFNPTVIGITGDIGVFQLNPRSFPTYTVKDLQNPETNIRLGVQYLAYVKSKCSIKDDLGWLVCFNYGPKNARKVKHPLLFPYVKKVYFTMNGEL